MALTLMCFVLQWPNLSSPPLPPPTLSRGFVGLAGEEKRKGKKGGERVPFFFQQLISPHNAPAPLPLLPPAPQAKEGRGAIAGTNFAAVVSSPEARDRALMLRLWEISMQLLGQEWRHSVLDLGWEAGGSGRRPARP